ncbi:RDD family protein [Actinomadura sp. 21ATH]|uniref:RDD family protein n=1 Tax=Actinomadura sp. 21ATH TaxID=1735444 RepID=UPI0035C216AC
MQDLPAFSSASYAMPPVRTPAFAAVDAAFPAPVRRLAARAIDLAAVLTGAALPAWGFAAATGRGPAALLAAMLTAVLAAGFAYEAVSLAGWSRTPGKRLLGLRVVGADGAPLSRRTAVLRAADFPLGVAVAGLVPVLGQILWVLDALSLLWDRPRRRCWHDRLAGTVVIGTDARPRAGGPAAPVPAPPGRRLAARLIDQLLVAVPAAGLAALWTAAAGGPALRTAAGGLLIYAACQVAYEGALSAAYGGTPGKRLLGLRVRDAAGGRLSPGRAFGRALCFPLAFPLVPVLGALDVLWALWDRPSRRCLHDRAAGTVVVRG